MVRHKARRDGHPPVPFDRKLDTVEIIVATFALVLVRGRGGERNRSGDFQRVFVVRATRLLS